MAAKKKTAQRRRRSQPSPRPAWQKWLFALLLSAAVTLLYFFLYVRPAQARQNAIPGRAIDNTSELQIALARQGYSPGSIDGKSGKQTRQALLAFQQQSQLELTGELDAATARKLKIQDPVFARIELIPADFAKIAPKPGTWRERGQVDRMRYHSILEMVGEHCQTDPDYIRQLNPATNWNQLAAGDSFLVPLVSPFQIRGEAARIQISLSERILQVVDIEGNLLFHCPVSIARKAEKRPQGELTVKVRVEDPNYTFNPAILTAAAAREGITRKFVIQPGPNNPVGSVWIGLSLPSYGIHGTPGPESVGRTESSGCFRLANWNAKALLKATKVGMPVQVSP